MYSNSRYLLLFFAVQGSSVVDDARGGVVENTMPISQHIIQVISPNVVDGGGCCFQANAPVFDERAWFKEKIKFLRNKFKQDKANELGYYCALACLKEQYEWLNDEKYNSSAHVYSFRLSKSTVIDSACAFLGDIACFYQGSTDGRCAQVTYKSIRDLMHQEMLNNRIFLTNPMCSVSPDDLLAELKQHVAA